MKYSALVYLVGAAIAAASAIAGCSDDSSTPAPTLRPSAAGESCARTSDCDKNLVCVDNFCVTAGTSTSGKDGGTTTPPPQPNLGGSGETCSRRADCEIGLACIQGVCTSGASSENPDATAPVPRLGDRGETCTTVSDCAANLTCIPNNAGLGVCDVAKYGLVPTGKTCGGECNTAADCCELPPNGGTGYKSCEDLAAAIGADVTTACTNPSGTALDTPCFLYNTYCKCTDTTWACTANKCVYNAACQNDGPITGGCPQMTRTGTATASSLCDTNTNKCAGTSAPECMTATDCNAGLGVADDFSDVCSAGECTCYQSSCYRKCTKDLDCPDRYTCDPTKKVCVSGPGCQTNAECAKSLENVLAQCQSDGTCAVPCTNDHECSGSGVTGTTGLSPFNGKVCSSNGICESLGCSSDAECASTASGVKTFCYTPAASTTGSVRSAIAD